MVSKSLLLHMMLATLLAVQLKAKPSSPVIHVINAVKENNNPPINIRVKADGSLKEGSAQLKPRQSYEIKVDVKDVYYAIALFGFKFTAFHAYDPARDKGRTAIYWMADNEGFAISYDVINWNKVAPWEFE